MEWLQLNNKLQLEEILQLSESSKVAIFKHSTRCGISKMVLKNFENEVDILCPENMLFYFLDLIKYREVSNAVANSLKIQHESPQLLVIEKGNVISHSSHSNISASEFRVTT